MFNPASILVLEISVLEISYSKSAMVGRAGLGKKIDHNFLFKYQNFLIPVEESIVRGINIGSLIRTFLASPTRNERALSRIQYHGHTGKTTAIRLLFLASLGIM